MIEVETQTREEQVVRAYEPSAGFRTMTRIGNVVMRPLLRSGIGSRMHDLALLSFSGRRSGTRYTVPVGYHELDGDVLILTASPWRVNLRGGADVELVHDGRPRSMRAELIEDPDEVATIYAELIRRIGIGKAKATTIGLDVLVDRMPTREELREALAGRRAVVRLRPR
ncbi:MAG TPA: nitroreductase/quinone reductase family protein [Actinomycetota bacterium]|nr:nitroreductase/quinone reductase family protein [Actinomycetota bacterium]